MKARSKNDSWWYPAAGKASRRRIRRIANKRHRRADRKLIREEEKL